jgi:hypothetical protein
MNMNSVKNCKCRVSGSGMQLPINFVCDEFKSKLSFKKCASIRSLYCDMKAGIEEPEETTIATQLHGKYLSAARNTYTAIEELLGHCWTALFSARPVPRPKRTKTDC